MNALAFLITSYICWRISFLRPHAAMLWAALSGAWTFAAILTLLR